MSYAYLLYGDEGERELAAAEVKELSGGHRTAERIVEALRPIEIARTGYAASGIEVLAKGTTVDAVCEELRRSGLAADRFAIDVRRIPRGLPVRRRDAANALAIAINGAPDLTNPAIWFAAFVCPEGVWFGRRIDAGRPDWERFARKPYDCSSALPARAARAIVNLVVRGGERVVDPCCGSGTLLLHAAALGAHVTGFDINRKMVGATNKNLAHFGFEPSACVADAGELRGEYDVVLANLPYNQMSAASDAQVRRIAGSIVRLAPRGVLVAASDLSAEIRGAGARATALIQLRKFSLTRLILVFERAGS